MQDKNTKQNIYKVYKNNKPIISYGIRGVLC